VSVRLLTEPVQEWTCDECGAVEKMTGYETPEGWDRVTINSHRLAGGLRHLTLCGPCANGISLAQTINIAGGMSSGSH